MRPVRCCWPARARARSRTSSSRRADYRAIAEHVRDFVEVDASAAAGRGDRAGRGGDRRACRPVAGDLRRDERAVATRPVTDAGRGSAVAFIRSLGRRGVARDSRGLGRLQPRFPVAIYDRPAPPSIGPPTAPRRSWRRSALRPSRADIDLVVPVTDEIGLPLAAARASFKGLADARSARTGRPRGGA